MLYYVTLKIASNCYHAYVQHDYSNTGVYKLTSLGCNKHCIVQAGPSEGGSKKLQGMLSTFWTVSTSTDLQRKPQEL
jgi:hypothetical protein